MRFEPVEYNGRYKVRDTVNGKFVIYSYSKQPVYENNRKESVWGNYYAARGFCQKMHTLVTGKTCTE